MTYLTENYKYWQKGYDAPNVESFIFRFYGFYLKKRKNLKLLDFGCGQGAAVNFFNTVKVNSRCRYFNRYQKCKKKCQKINISLYVLNLSMIWIRRNIIINLM